MGIKFEIINIIDILTSGQPIIRALPLIIHSKKSALSKNVDKGSTLNNTLKKSALSKNVDKHPNPGGGCNSWSQHRCKIFKSISNVMEKVRKCTVH